MRPVILESPLAASSPEGVAKNVAFTRACLRDTLKRGESALVSHLLWTQVLDDEVPEDRALGMEAGHVWYAAGAQAAVVYTDRGISPGMKAGILRAEAAGVPVEYRMIHPDLPI